MLAYQNEELRAVHEDLRHRDLGEIPRTIMSATQWDKEEQERLAQRFDTLWSRWSREFLDERAQTEFNAFKHGMRARLGGFSIAIGREDTPGEPAPPESIVALGSSAFGSAFFTAERVDGRLHLHPRRTNRNWYPEGMAYGLDLLAMSIQNVVSYLRIINHDDPAACRFPAPADDAEVDLPWQYSPASGSPQWTWWLPRSTSELGRRTKSLPVFKTTVLSRHRVRSVSMIAYEKRRRSGRVIGTRRYRAPRLHEKQSFHNTRARKESIAA